MSGRGFQICAQPVEHITAAVFAFSNVGRRVEPARLKRQVRIDPRFKRTNPTIAIHITPRERQQRRYPVFDFDAKLNPVGPSWPSQMSFVQTGYDAKHPFPGAFHFEHNPIRAYRDVASAKVAQLRGYILAELVFESLDVHEIIFCRSNRKPDTKIVIKSFNNNLVST